MTRDEVTELRFSSNDKFIAVAQNRKIIVYESPSRQARIEPFTLIKKINTSHLAPITYISWSPDSRFVVTACEENSVHIYNVFSLKGYATRKLVGHRSQVLLTFFDKDRVRIYHRNEAQLISLT